MLTYILKSAIVLSLLFVPYALMLRKDSFFRFNRMMLLLIMLLSLCLPLMILPIFDFGFLAFESKPEIIFGTPVIIGVEGNMTSAQVVAPTSATAVGVSPWSVASWIYLAGICIVALVRCAQAAMVWRRIHQGVVWKEKKDGAVVYCHIEPVPPFSCFNAVVISEEDYETNADVILRHELGHVKHRHSFDILLLNVCQTIQWANPFVWLMGGALRDIHEYEADDTVLRSGVNPRQYMSLLMRKAVGSSSYAFANGFNHSMLKKRITMMLKKKTNPWMRMKAFYVIPVALIALSAFATPLVSRTSDSESDNPADKGKVKDFIPKNEISAQEINHSGMMSLEENQFSAEERTADVALDESQSVTEPEQMAEAEPITANDLKAADAESTLSESPAEQAESPKVPAVPDDDPVFNQCEVMPEYPGGFVALFQMLSNNIRYPKIAHDNHVQGVVHVSFIVEKTGECTDFKIGHTQFCTAMEKATDDAKQEIQVISYSDDTKQEGQDGGQTPSEKTKVAQQALCDEALRVCKLMEPFKPGLQDGKPVRVHFSLPVRYKLN